jgi:hypothetical protein
VSEVRGARSEAVQRQLPAATADVAAGCHNYALTRLVSSDTDWPLKLEQTNSAPWGTEPTGKGVCSQTTHSTIHLGSQVLTHIYVCVCLCVYI